MRVSAANAASSLFFFFFSIERFIDCDENAEMEISGKLGKKKHGKFAEKFTKIVNKQKQSITILYIIR